MTPPLPAWPEGAYAGEPAHGFFRRLAYTNGQLSARSLAIDLGLATSRAIFPKTLLDFCLEFPVRDKERLIDATPSVFAGQVELLGQNVRRSDWSAQRVRVCRACLNEHPFHRFWFDIRLIHLCPFHGDELIDQLDGERLAWWSPDVVATPTGRSLRMRRPQVSLLNEDMSAFAARRFGLIPQAEEGALLGSSLSNIANAAEVLGYAIVHGRSGGRMRFRRREAERFHARDVGYAVLREGVEEIGRALRKQPIDESESLIDEAPWKREASSWFIPAVADLSDPHLRGLLMTGIGEARAALNVYVRKGSNARENASLGALRSRKDIARDFGINPPRLTNIATRIGLADRRLRGGRFHVYEPHEVLRLEAAIADLITWDEARQILGLTNEQFGAIDGKLIRSALTLGGNSFRHRRYFRSELHGQIRAVEAFLVDEADRVRPPEVKAVLQPRARLACVGISRAEASAVLGVAPLTIAALVDEGHLASAQNGLGRGIEEATLAAFQREYIKVADLAERLDCDCHNAAWRLRKLGVQLLQLRKPSAGTFARRADVLEWLPDEAARTGSFWTSVAEMAQEVKSTFRLKVMTGDEALFRSADMKTCIQILRDEPEDSVDVTITANRRRSARRFAYLLQHEQQIRSSRMGLEIIKSVDSIDVRLQVRNASTREGLRKILSLAELLHSFSFSTAACR